MGAEPNCPPAMHFRIFRRAFARKICILLRKIAPKSIKNSFAGGGYAVLTQQIFSSPKAFPAGHIGNMSKGKDEGIGQICTSKPTWFDSRSAIHLCLIIPYSLKKRHRKLSEKQEITAIWPQNVENIRFFCNIWHNILCKGFTNITRCVIIWA